MILDQLVLLMQLTEPHFQLLTDHPHGFWNMIGWGRIVRSRVDRKVAVGPLLLAGERLVLRDRLNLVSPKLHPDGRLRFGKVDVNDIAPHPEGAPVEVDVVALVSHLDQASQQFRTLDLVSHLEEEHHLAVLLWRADAVDARHRGDDDHVLTLQQGACCRKPQTVQFVIKRGGLLDVEITVRNVGLRLVVVVEADEILNRVFRKEGLELVVELCGKHLVVDQHQRGPLPALDDIGHRVGLPGAGDAEQHLMPMVLLQSIHQRLVGLGLIPGGLKLGAELERHRGSSVKNVRRPFNETVRIDRAEHVESVWRSGFPP